MKEHSHQVRLIAVLAATTIALYVCWLMLRPFLAVLAWAAVLVIVFYPVHKQLSYRIKRRGLCALVSTTLVIVIVVLPLVVLTAAVTNELAGAARTFPTYMGQLMDPASITGRIYLWVQQRLGLDDVGLQVFAAEQLKNYGSAIVGRSVGMLGNVISGLVKTFFVIITMYYMFRDGEKIVKALPGVLPLGPEQSENFIARITQVISASVYGVVTIALLQGVLGGLAFWVLGVPSPLLWGVVLAFVCMIPLAGSFFVWGPAAIYLMLTNHLTKGILLVIWGALVISTIDNFLRPKLMQNQTKLHELLVLFAVLGGMSMFGLLGIVLGPVVLAITIGLLDTFKAKEPVLSETEAVEQH
ncbi:MAG TPA: AI-2E family transporter [Pyrinomonadaceae bacterium]|nr:AI-2E family transporter [Pyrinomonadaceae bacterium]